jgi:antitoxin component YwqK of YwqJK toxin-antitoxin module
MKLVFPLAILAIFISSCSGSTESSQEEIVEIDSNYCDCNELTFDEPYNHFYRFERREPFTGLCEEFYTDSTLKMTKNFVEGKVHGKMITYHENGQVHEEQEFDMNFQEGERIKFTKSGQVMFHALYKRGKQVKVIETQPWLTIED